MKKLNEFAELLIQAVALKENMNLQINAEAQHRPLVAALTKAAYRRGARYVGVEINLPELTKTRLDESKTENLDYFPQWHQEKFKEIVDERWSIISLSGPEDPDILDSCDSQAIGKLQGAWSRLRQPFLQAISRNEISWVVSGMPTDGWARKVLKNPQATADKLWEILYSIYRLDKDDPLQAWKEQSQLLTARSSYLNQMRFDSFRFQARGTDLEVGLLTGSRWIGGSSETMDGRDFFPNIPTEEIFTTPDFRRTNGRVQLTRPVFILGKAVENGWMEFRDGQVIDFGASKNQDILKSYFDVDPQSRFLGEIAIVDQDNPIANSNLVFHNTLFDENASCHIALGNGYTDAVEGLQNAEPAELLINGVNVCTQHSDLMFGSSDMKIIGKVKNGQETLIFSDGHFLLPE